MMHGIDIPGDPQVRIGNLIDAFRNAPIGADLEVLAGMISKGDDPLASCPALVVTINGLPFPVTLPEAVSCADMIDVTISLQADLPDRDSLRQLSAILRSLAAKRQREEEVVHGHHYIN